MNELLTNFLLSTLPMSKWLAAEVDIEIQPGMLGMSGFLVDLNSKKVSLRTKPSETLKEAIWNFHKQTAIDELSKWNKYRLLIFKDMSMKAEFIWDAIWQAEIDSLNRQVKERNPEYVMPRWPWQTN